MIKKCREKVKQVLAQAPVLTYFSFEKEDCASIWWVSGRIGVCLLQDGHEVPHVPRTLTA